MNIAAHMVRAGKAFRDAPAVAQGQSTLFNYAQLAERVARIAAALIHDRGLVAGERVAVISHNCPEYIELLYGIWHAGLVAVPINAKLHADEFAYILHNSGARLAFVSDKLATTLVSISTSSQVSLVGIGTSDYADLLKREPEALVDRAPDDPAWLFYTSGTTGKPKGATLSHRNLYTMCHCYFTDVDQTAPWSTILHAAPMSHGSGLYGLAYVIQGGCHVIPESSGFDSDEIYQLLANWSHSAFFAAPTMIRRLLDQDPGTSTEKLKAIVYGGGPMYVEDCLEALDRFGPKLSQLYGQGESPMTITALDAGRHADRQHPQWLARLGSVGVPQSAVEVRVADAEDRPLPVGEVGEILVRGDSVMLGYWENPAATAEALRGGWLHTGDCGTFDVDGFLTLKDRTKDLIISGGSNIYPREVEEVLLRHPGVAEAAVVGRPDRQWGEMVVAFVVPRPDARLVDSDLDGFCKANIAGFKRPKQYHLVENLPKNNYGKILKRELRAGLTSESS